MLTDYYTFLEGFELPGTEAKANYYFGRKALLRKVRPRYISDLRMKLSEEPERLHKYLAGSDYDKYFILRDLNKEKYQYFSFHVLINLSGILLEDYDIFLKLFEKRLIVNDYHSSYGSFALSKYMMKNFDFLLARKMAGLSMRYRENISYLNILKENYIKTEWFYTNSDSLLADMKIVECNE